jgi:hypothetical protein
MIRALVRVSRARAARFRVEMRTATGYCADGAGSYCDDGTGSACQPGAMENRPGEAALERVWAGLPAAARAALETGLAPTDLQTLLLGVTRSRARAVSPAQVARRWREDRFVQPSSHDPRRVAQIEARLWELLPARWVGVELSPVAPLGTVSALAPVDQNRVVSTVRGTEVVSDPTNALAVEAAIRRRAQPPSVRRVDLATCQRVLRAQRFGPGFGPHFRLFALVSSARDRGSGATEAELLIDHIGVWQSLVGALLPGAEVWLTYTVFDDAVLAERFRDTIAPALAGTAVALIEEPDRVQGSGYYAGAAIGLRVRIDGALGSAESATRGVDGETVDLGDGGLTTWTARLVGDAKERCLISCVATERLTALVYQD